MKGDTEGRWSAMATLSPLKRRWAFVNRYLWPMLRWLNEHGIALPRALTKLSMIGFARWSLVDDVPPKKGFGILEAVRLPKPYILFETNWNGDSDAYFESFSYVSEKGISMMWRGTYGMPKVKRVGEFIRFINDNKHRPEVFCTGYPQASGKMIRSALEVKWQHDQLNPLVPGMSDGDFLCNYTTFLVDAQKQNPPLPNRYAPGVGLKVKKTGSFSAIAPYETNRHGNVRDELHALPSNWAPPNTHFARWVPIEEMMWRTLPGKFKNSQPSQSYLVFGAWFDGERDDYLRKLHVHERVWRHCDGWDGGDEARFIKYLCAHEYDIGIPYSSYEGVPVGEIEDALQLNDRVWKFAVDNQMLTTPARAEELRQAWIEAFPP